MGCHRYTLYMAGEKEKWWVDLTCNPQIDLYFYRCRGMDVDMICLVPSLPFGTAFYLKSLLEKEDSLVARMLQALTAAERGPQLLFKRKQKIMERELKRLGYSGPFRLERPGEPFRLESPGRPFQPERSGQDNFWGNGDKDELQEVAGVLEGRMLFEEELERALVEKGHFLDTPLEEIMQVLYLRGEVERYPAVGIQAPGQPACYRCGEKQKIMSTECVSAGPACYYCEECLVMGESRLCKVLYGKTRLKGQQAEGERKEIRVCLDFELTPAQKDAARALKNFVERDSRGEALVWAVCGAGKTEVSFEAAASILSKGGKVLFAIPRRDVVQELASRLHRAFPGVNFSVLYGGSKGGKYRDAEIVIATTHQVIRFYHNFDLVVLDEVDAFPYRDSRMLYHAVQRARVAHGKIIYLTATPRPLDIKRAKAGQAFLATIPVRHHGYPLPVPELVQAKSLKFVEGRYRVAGCVLDFLHRSIEGERAQVFVFVPTVGLVQRVAVAIQEALRLPPFDDWQGIWVRWSHARDPERDIKRRAFVNGDFPVFVTTSIMERGITVARANVLVLFAENERIYDAAALVQMAGRSGRSSTFPAGRVRFVGSRITQAMEDARRQVTEMNKEAARKGYLKTKSFSEAERQFSGNFLPETVLKRQNVSK